MTYRLFIGAIFMLAIYGAVRWVRDRGMPTEPAPLEMKLQDLPKLIGEWKGEDVALDPEMFEAIGAETVLERQYRDRIGHAVSLHVAVFEKSMAQGLPHVPEVCYTAGGWQLAEAKLFPLDPSSGPTNMAKLMGCSRHGENADCLYWYQIDGAAYATGDRQRQLTLGLRGRPIRPPVVKVMLFTNATNADEVEKLLKSFAAQVFAWTRNFH